MGTVYDNFKNDLLNCEEVYETRTQNESDEEAGQVIYELKDRSLITLPVSQLLW